MRILSIDGGGIRGLIPAIVLAELERRTGRRTAELFDLVAGTSTGGILACALTLPDGRYSARELAALYEEEGPRIFERSLLKRIRSVDGLLDERYDDRGLNAALERYLGTGRLAEAVPPILVTAYDLAGRRPFRFRTGEADAALTDVARATSAAPTYFEPVEVGGRPLIDGGVFAVNPALVAVTEAGFETVELVLSLGTGELTRPIALRDARGWGQLEWARPLLDVVLDGVADTVDRQLAALLGPRYVRLQTRLDIASDDLDDASERNLERLREEAERLIRERDAELDALAARLTAA